MREIKTKISASLLAADFCDLRGDLKRVRQADLLHIDVMDGNYVPNISFGLPVLEAVQNCSTLPLDIHLMIVEPQRYLAQFASFAPEFITVHYEAVTHLQRTLGQIRELGVKAGVALNPHTPLQGLEYVLDDLDLILIMTVNPGYGGQAFLPSVLKKIAQCRKMVGPRPIELQVDGGVSLKTIPALKEAGANNFVAGTAIFQAEDAAAYIQALRLAAN